MNRTTRLHRSLELSGIFILTPLFFYLNWIHLPKLAGLIIVAAGCFIILYHDPAYGFKSINMNIEQVLTRSFIRHLAIKSFVVGALISGLVWWSQPGGLFSLPLAHPVLWAVIMLLYPVFSALPQEFIYRVFFFHRYQQLFPGKWVMIAASALTFSYLHIVYDNAWALTLALAGGLFFSKTYSNSQSLWQVTLEHTVYGWIIFTSGMGHYFFTGV